MADYVLGNIFIRENLLVKIGQFTESHKHNFDHVTYITAGAALCEKLEPIKFNAKGVPTKFKTIKAIEKHANQGLNWILIEKDVYHRITALEAGTRYHCVYSHRNPQGEVVLEYDGWQEAYV